MGRVHPYIACPFPALDHLQQQSKKLLVFLHFQHSHKHLFKTMHNCTYQNLWALNKSVARKHYIVVFIAIKCLTPASSAITPMLSLHFWHYRVNLLNNNCCGYLRVMRIVNPQIVLLLLNSVSDCKTQYICFRQTTGLCENVYGTP